MQRRMVLVLPVAALLLACGEAPNGAANWLMNPVTPLTVNSRALRTDGQPNGSGWTINSPIPEPLGVAQGSAVASADGSRIYYIGGITGALVATNKVRVYLPENDVWFDAADIPVPGIRTFGSAVELNGFIYVIGGFDGTNVLDSTWIYDESKNVWLQGANMPAPRFGSAVAADGSTIWAVAGAQGLSLADESYTIWRYDPTTDNWSYYDHLGTFMGRTRSVMLPNGDLYFLGGGFDGNNNCFLNVRVPFSGACRPQIPFGVTDAAVATDGVRIYIAGGTGPVPRTQGRLQVFNTVSRTWLLGPAMPSAVDNTSGVIANGIFYVMGGYDGSTPVSVNYSLSLSSLGALETVSASSMNPDALEALDNGELKLSSQLDTSTWSLNWPIPEPFGVAQGSTLASIDGSLIYHIGGLGFYASNRVRVYSPADDSRDASSMRSPWWDVASVPVSRGIRSYGSAVELNGFFYIFGGVSGTQSTGEEVLNATWIYDETNDVWFPGANMPGFRFGPAVATDGDVIWVVGGYNEFIGAEQTVWSYNPKADAYSTGFANMPSRLGRIRGVWLPDGKVHIFGGEPAYNYHFVYDTFADAWSSAPTMPIAVLDPATVTDGTRIYLAGANFAFPRQRGHLQIFDPATSSWSEGPQMPPWPNFRDSGIDNTSGTIANGVFYVLGGYNGGSIYFNYSISLSELTAF